MSSESSISDLEPLPLSSICSHAVLGAGNFTFQSHPNPETLPVRAIIKRALECDIRTFDTSPYYGPSESLLGDAFAHLASEYSREEYILMTKVGRISATKFDYSPSWIRASVTRSLQRLRTTYLDVVFCHDVEYVSDEEVVTAVGVLLELVQEKKVRYVGCSGYVLEKLVKVANMVRERYSRPLDAVQTWGQLTLQNTRFEKEGLPKFRAAGVGWILCSSPLCIGLLRANGVPVGSLGDWHPAPPGLRNAALEASAWLEAQGEQLAALAIRFCMSKVVQFSSEPTAVAMVLAATSVAELDMNVRSMRIAIPQENIEKVRKQYQIDEVQPKNDDFFVAGVRKILGSWVDYTFPDPVVREGGGTKALKKELLDYSLENTE